MNFNGNNNKQGNGGGIGIVVLIIFVILCIGSCSQNGGYDDPYSSGYHHYMND